MSRLLIFPVQNATSQQISSFMGEKLVLCRWEVVLQKMIRFDIVFRNSHSLFHSLVFQISWALKKAKWTSESFSRGAHKWQTFQNWRGQLCRQAAARIFFQEPFLVAFEKNPRCHSANYDRHLPVWHTNFWTINIWHWTTGSPLRNKKKKLFHGNETGNSDFYQTSCIVGVTK